ncbi:MAG: PAS domain-containing sensor histidine kinase [Chitinophagaceae bacterium]|nr:PAS domain-containing sensor histidine kinase [Chitinophagaceae bacterium]
MELLPQLKIHRNLMRWALYLTVAVLFISILSFLGWLFNVEYLKHPVPGLVAMNPLTAICFIFCSTSFLLFIRSQKKSLIVFSQLLAVLVLFAALMKLISLTGILSFSIDQLFFLDALNTDFVGTHVNRMAPNTALCMAFSGIALLRMHSKVNYKRLLSSQSMALVILFLSFFSLLGYLYGVEALYEVFSFIPMAMQTALCFLFFSLMIMFAQPGEGFMKQITSIHSGSYLSRRFLPAAFLVPSLIALARLWGQRAGFYNLEFGTALLITSLIITFIALIWYNTVLLNKRDVQQRESERQSAYLATLVQQTSDGILSTDADLHIQSWNMAAEKIYGFTFNEVKGKQIGTILKSNLTPDQVQQSIKELNKKGFFRDEYIFIDKAGNNINVQATVTALKDNAGNINGYVAVHRDITDRKKLEGELRMLNQNLEQQVKEKTLELRTVFERVSDAVIAINDKWQYVYVNQKAQKIFRLGESDLVSKSVFELFQNEGSEFAASFQQAFRTQEYVYTELYDSMFKNWFEIHMYPSPTGLSIYFRDITKRKNAEQEAQHSYQQIRQLSAHVQNIREEERTNIAREIHDDLGQQLTVMKMDLSWLNKKINTENDGQVKQKITDLLGMIDGAVQSIRRIATELRPSILDDLGLLPAIEWHLDNFEKKSGITTNFQETVSDLYLNNAIKTTVFRIFQESLTNVARHAEATNLNVVLEQGDNSFTLHIEDNGKGFIETERTEKKSWGLLGMRERAEGINGKLHIISKPGIGTKVTVTVPVNTKY